ncbi:hypothetical protein Taro_042545 [Colocasia esculenta]|uniref:Retrotransposon gag domain-containing protein n=1 Tax=Colocasia esculenta TaxID=4460 RepID=A0A843WT51_COLES|nr:hypothetical protein [Colocasia esculenta]
MRRDYSRDSASSLVRSYTSDSLGARHLRASSVREVVTVAWDPRPRAPIEGVLQAAGVLEALVVSLERRGCLESFPAQARPAPGGGDGAVVVVPVPSSGSPSRLYVTLGDMAPRRCRQARELIEQQDESDMPAPGQVQEEVSAEESFFRTLYQGAWQPGQAAAGGQPLVPPPSIPEQQADPEVEQLAVQQASDLTVTQYHQRFVRLLRHVPHVASSEQACAERFIAGLRPDLRWGMTAHMCATLGEVVAKATALERETWQPQQHQGGASSRSSSYQRSVGSCLLAGVDGAGNRSVSRGLRSNQSSREPSRADRRQSTTLVVCQATLGGIARWGKSNSRSSQCSTCSSYRSTSSLLSSRHLVSSSRGSTICSISSCSSISSSSRTSNSISFPSTSSRRSSPSRHRNVGVDVVV